MWAGRDRWVLPLATLGFWTCYTMIRPLLAPYATALGASALVTGIVVAAQAVPGALFALPGGAIADRFGNRATSLLGAAVMATGGTLMASTTSIEALIGAQALVGGGGILMWVAIQRAVITPTGGDTARLARDRTIATNSLYVSGGLVAGPLVGGWTADHFGYRASFLVFAVLAASLLPITVAMPDGRASRHPIGSAPAHSTTRGRAWALAKTPGMSATLLASFLVLFLLEFRTSFHPLYLDDIGFSPSVIGVIIAVSAAFGVIARPALPHLSRRLGDPLLLALCLVTGAVTVGAVAFTRSLLTLLILAAVSGVALGLGQPFLLALVANFTSREERGLGVGMRMVANRTAQWICPLILGGLLSFAGFAGGFTAAAALALALTITATRRLQKAARGDPPGSGGQAGR